MQKYALAAAFVLALATPALAASFYVGLDTATNQCQVMNQMPDGTAVKMVGTAYSSQAEAQQAISNLAECTR